MKIKTVKQYQCDFCGKKNYSAAAMNKHEKNCTMNPDRECRMCKLREDSQTPLSELVAILPKMEIVDDNYGGVRVLNAEEIETAMKAVREKADNCPTCILATIRQKGVYVSITGFDYKKECKEFWNNYNESQRQEDYHVW